MMFSSVLPSTRAALSSKRRPHALVAQMVEGATTYGNKEAKCYLAASVPLASCTALESWALLFDENRSLHAGNVGFNGVERLLKRLLLLKSTALKEGLVAQLLVARIDTVPLGLERVQQLDALALVHGFYFVLLVGKRYCAMNARRGCDDELDSRGPQRLSQ